MKSFILWITVLTFCRSQAQSLKLTGIVRDSKTLESLPGVSITIFESDYISGGISNGEGRFSIITNGKPDSVIFSMIGYRYTRFSLVKLPKGDSIIVELRPESIILNEVEVRPVSAMNIIREAAGKMNSYIPSGDYESLAFYREIIQDSTEFYSVAEAIFKTQFSVQKKSFRLKLEKGRSKEDVAYTRLFEDYHPGGGPEDAVSQCLSVRPPDFLNAGSLKNYNYKIDSTIAVEDNLVYVISFDQKPGIREALEKGYLYINASDYSLLKFKVSNSPRGTAYIKSLTGMDKIFAGILHIDLTVKGWERTASYIQIGGKLFLSYAKMIYDIGYKQPKKSLNLNLRIHTELMVTDFQRLIVREITKEEEWKRKNLVIGLPTDFDPEFWGSANILDPTTEVKDILSSISKKNREIKVSGIPDDWLYLNKGFFISYKLGDSIVMVPVAKCNWEDNETGGMMYKMIKGDFNMEVMLSIKKRSNRSGEPDNGFQQGGIIVRSPGSNHENYLIYALGTGGSDVLKYFLKRTSGSRTKIGVEKTGDLAGWLRIEKKGKRLRVYKRKSESDDWIQVDEYEFDWLKTEMQVGFTVMARFAGTGPKQRPDLEAVFSNLKLEKL